jgi:hypothetical protein
MFVLFDAEYCNSNRPQCSLSWTRLDGCSLTSSLTRRQAKWDLRIYDRVSLLELVGKREKGVGVFLNGPCMMHLAPIATVVVVVVDRSQRPAIISPAGNVLEGISNNLGSTFLQQHIIDVI